jgi:hypothetical protein
MLGGLGGFTKNKGLIIILYCKGGVLKGPIFEMLLDFN